MSIGRWVFWGFVLVAAFFLITEHRAHTSQYLPFLLVLACPLMHLLHKHGAHSGRGDKGAREAKSAGGKAELDKTERGGCH